MVMEKYVDEIEVFDKFKKVIDELYPVKKPRMELVDGYIPSRNKDLKINFYFYRDQEDIIRMQMYFSKGNNEMSKYFLISDKLSNDMIGKLISFLLKEFPYVMSVQTNLMGFEIESVIGLEHFDEEGISCSRVNLKFDTHPKLYREFTEMFQNYLNYILSNYMEYMSMAPQIKESYKKYRANLKKDIINSLSREELENLIGLLTDEEFKDLLIGMNTKKFFEVCDKLGEDVNKPRSLKLINGVPKRIVGIE